MMRDVIWDQLKVRREREKRRQGTRELKRETRG